MPHGDWGDGPETYIVGAVSLALLCDAVWQHFRTRVADRAMNHQPSRALSDAHSPKCGTVLVAVPERRSRWSITGAAFSCTGQGFYASDIAAGSGTEVNSGDGKPNIRSRRWAPAGLLPLGRVPSLCATMPACPLFVLSRLGVVIYQFRVCSRRAPHDQLFCVNARRTGRAMLHHGRFCLHLSDDRHEGAGLGRGKPRGE